MTKLPVIPVINCGSSSIKFSILDTASCDCLPNGMVEGINAEWTFLSLNGDESVALAQRGRGGTLQAITGTLAQRDLTDSVALAGHRVAHGDDLFTESVIISEGITNDICQVSSLAPLRSYASLSGIASAQRLFLQVIQVAVPGTSFHQTPAPEASFYGLSWEYCQSLGVRRYGLHGTSHCYVSRHALALFGLPEQEGDPVIAHLGGGAPICVVCNGCSADISMRMTPPEGLMTGTRSSDADFGATVWITGKTRQTLSDLERVANTASGLLGISGLPPNLRVLEQTWHEGHAHVCLTIKTFVYRIAHHITGHAAALQRLDGIIFTGGIDENSVLIRRLMGERLAVSDLETDVVRNQQSNSTGERLTSADGSRVRCMVIPTNGKYMIALDAIRLGQTHTAAALA